MTPVSEIMEDRDTQIAHLIRKEIAAREHHKAKCGYIRGTLEECCLRYEILGLRRALAFVDLNPDS